MKRVQIVHELLARHVPTLVVREKVEHRRAIHLALEDQTQGRIAEGAEHQAGHVAAGIPVGRNWNRSESDGTAMRPERRLGRESQPQAAFLPRS